MYLIDTNVLSELRPGKPQASPRVLAWAATVPQSQIFLSAITVLEQELGILQLERRVPPQGSALRAWWDRTRRGFGDRILALDAQAALKCAAMHVPDPKSYRNSMIAAIALTHGFTLVTRNVADFERTGVKVIDPWTIATSAP